MSIALDNVSNCARIGGGSGFIHGNGPPGGFSYGSGDHRPSSDSCSRSSIGENSDDSCRSSTGGGDDSGNTTEEVQSAYRGGGGGSFSSMNALEEALPIRRGISSFYNGKSKSFTSLLESSTTSSSVRDIAKPENAYTRRRRNLLATGLASSPLRTNGGGAGTFKRMANFSRTKLALAMSMSMSNSGPNKSPDMNANFFTSYPAAQLSLSLQDSRDLSAAYRSFSAVDLQQFCAPSDVHHHLLNKPETQSEKHS